MNNLSTVNANTLFHFTNKKGLVGILTNNFYPRFSLENHSAFYPKKYQDTEIAIPMVCFCDIPLSNIRNHIKTYKSYAIGLNKEWGERNGICPILYYWNNSISTRIFKNSFEGLGECIDEAKSHFWDRIFGDHDIPRGKIDKLFESQSYELARTFDGLVGMLGFTKQYKGDFYRNGKELKNYCFYDEREWRYVPDIRGLSYDELPVYMKKKSWLDEEQRRAENSKLENQKAVLEFTPDDVKYIIVSKEVEIPDMIKKIQEAKSKYTEDARKSIIANDSWH